VVVGQSFPALELIETTLTQSGHRVLTTTKPEEAVELARSVRIDVLVGDRGAALTALEQELQLVQPKLRVVHVCEPDELQLAGGNGRAVIARPVSLPELDAVVRDAACR
jgi:DNA-binding response OmpR family regulator